MFQKSLNEEIRKKKMVAKDAGCQEYLLAEGVQSLLQPTPVRKLSRLYSQLLARFKRDLLEYELSTGN